MYDGVFLDRDGTLIDDPGYLSNPGDVVLRPGAADAVRALNEAGIATRGPRRTIGRRVLLSARSGQGRLRLSKARNGPVSTGGESTRTSASPLSVHR